MALYIKVLNFPVFRENVYIKCGIYCISNFIYLISVIFLRNVTKNTTLQSNMQLKLHIHNRNSFTNA